jgi:tripartite-type tricarboxylate transporter receptor subunit TctC
LDKVKKIPQGTTAEVATAVASGMGDICITYAAVALPHLQAGKADLILVAANSVPAPWNKDPNVVTMEGAGLPKMQLGAVMGIGVNKPVPQSHVDWLYKLFKAAASTDLHKKREQTNPGLIINIMGPAESEKAKMEIYTKAEPVVRALGLHVDQKK